MTRPWRSAPGPSSTTGRSSTPPAACSGTTSPERLRSAPSPRGRGAIWRRPPVPVFWVASDDHDFAEVRSVSVLDDAGQIVNIRYAPEREPAGEPAARIVLDSTITALVEDLGRALPAGLNRDGLLARLAEC